MENNGSNSELVSALLAALLGRQQPLPPQVVAVPPTHQPHPLTPGSTSAARDEVNGGLQAGQGTSLSSLSGGGGRRHPFSVGGVQSTPRRNRIGVSSSSSIDNQAMSPLQKKSRISES